MDLKNHNSVFSNMKNSLGSCNFLPHYLYFNHITTAYYQMKENCGSCLINPVVSLFYFLIISVLKNNYFCMYVETRSLVILLNNV